MYKAGMHSIVYVTAPSVEVAKNLAHGIMNNNLAACINFISNTPSKSASRKNEVNEDSEIIVMIKTHTSKIDDLTTYVKSNQPYKDSEVISTKIANGSIPDLDWISRQI